MILIIHCGSSCIPDIEKNIDKLDMIHETVRMENLETVDFNYPNAVVPSLPGWIDPKQHSHASYFLNQAGKDSVRIIITCLLYDRPEITFCPMLYPLACLLRHYLSGKIPL